MTIPGNGALCDFIAVWCLSATGIPYVSISRPIE